MNLAFSEPMPARPVGEFRLDVRRHGLLIEQIAEPNLVVDNFKQIHSRLLGGSVTGRSVAAFGVGTSGTTPVGANTALTSAFTKALDSVTYPATNQVSFNFSLLATEANGKAILEFGLFTGDGTLYARKVRASALNKESDISFTGSWVITF